MAREQPYEPAGGARRWGAGYLTEMGGLPEMVDHGVDGLVVPSGQPRALSDAIRQLSQDPLLAQEMGRRGHERLQRDNTPSVHYERLMSVYESARTRRMATVVS